VNALDELLSSEAMPSTTDLRSATTIALSSLRHDRRVELLDGEQAHSLAIDLYHHPDIRTLIRTQDPYPTTLYEEDLREISSFVSRMQFEVVHEACLEDPRIRTLQRAIGARGAQMRVADVPYRATIYNTKLAMVARDFDNNAAGAYAVSEPSLVRALVRLHARMWRHGNRWNGGLQPTDRENNVDLADVLGELLDGSTDEAGTQRLHISLRTYRRRVHELLRQMGAASRFQAGVIAQERHYIDLVRDRDRSQDVAARSLSRRTVESSSVAWLRPVDDEDLLRGSILKTQARNGDLDLVSDREALGSCAHERNTATLSRTVRGTDADGRRVGIDGFYDAVKMRGEAQRPGDWCSQKVSGEPTARKEGHSDNDDDDEPAAPVLPPPAPTRAHHSRRRRSRISTRLHWWPASHHDGSWGSDRRETSNPAWHPPSKSRPMPGRRLLDHPVQVEPV
jgi:hypothetical protein